MRRNSLYILVIMLLAPVLAFGQGEVNKKGATAASFLKLDIGARAIGLGGAFSTIADDGTAMHYNPAGLADFTKVTFTYHNVDLYADIRQQFIGIAVPFGGANTFGFYVNYVDLGSIERTTTLSPNGMNPTEFCYSSDAAYALVFSRRLTDRVLFGVSVKYAVEKMWNESAVGASVDFGTIYEPGVGGLRLGMSIRHLGPEMRMDRGPGFTFYKQQTDTYPGQRQIPSKMITDKFPLPTVFTVGVSFDLVGPTSVLLANDMNRFSVISEANDAFDAPMRAIYAVEYEWNSMIALRSGVRQNYDAFRYSFGGGLKFPIRNSELLFDYAYADYGDLEGIYVTSLEIRF